LGVLGDANLQLGTLEFEGFDRVVADQLPLAVFGALLQILRHLGLDFIARQVLGQLLATRLARSADVLLDHPLARFFDGFGQAGSCVRRIVGIMKVESQLVRVVDVPLATATEGTLQKFCDREF
jgi:hypothetical protein